MQKIEDVNGVVHVVVPQKLWQQFSDRAYLMAGGDGWSNWRMGNALLSQEHGMYLVCPNYFLMPGTCEWTARFTAAS